MNSRPLVRALAVLVVALSLSCSEDALTDPMPSFKAGVAAREVIVDFSTFGVFERFQPDFYRSDGILFLDQCGTTGCVQWFISCCPPELIVGEDVMGAPLKATFTRPISNLSLRASLTLQGTVILILSAYDASDRLLATTSVTVTQDLGDPANRCLGCPVTVTLPNLPKPAKSFSLADVFVRSSYPEITHVPIGVSTISYTHWGGKQP